MRRERRLISKRTKSSSRQVGGRPFTLMALTLIVVLLIGATPSIGLGQNIVGASMDEKRSGHLMAGTPSREAASWVQSEWIFTTNGPVTVTPVIGDADWDWQQEVVVVSNDSVYYLRGSATIGLYANRSSRIPNSYLTALAIGDLGLDGWLDTVVGSSEGLVQCTANSNANGWGYNATGVIGSLLTNDIDKDMLGEVMAVSWDGTVYCINATGGLEWKYATGEDVFAAPILGDVDNDGQKELIIGSMSGTLYCFGDSGSVEWVYPFGGPIYPSLTISDVDGDTIPEIIVVVNGGLTCLHWHSPIGIHEEWAWSLDSYMWTALAVGDLDGDANLEEVVGSLDGRVYCCTNDITNNWDFYAGGFINNASIVIDNVDNDTQNEVVFTSADGRVYCLDSSGAMDWSYTTGNWFTTAPAIGDIDGDNLTEIVVGCGDSRVHCLTTYSSPNLPPPPDGVTGGIIGVLLSPLGIVGMLLCLVLLAFVVVRGKRRVDYSKSGSVSTAEEKTLNKPYEAVGRQTRLSVPSKPVCTICGATPKHADALYCWNCGSKIQSSSKAQIGSARARTDLCTDGKCMVCGLRLEKLDEVLSCPYCGDFAHKTHLLEWLHVKNYCPTCRSHLDERDISR